MNFCQEIFSGHFLKELREKSWKDSSENFRQIKKKFVDIFFKKYFKN